MPSVVVAADKSVGASVSAAGASIFLLTIEISASSVPWYPPVFEAVAMME